MGQKRRVDSGGSQGSYGQTHGKSLKRTRRGVGGTKFGQVEPTEVARKHHQSGGGDCGAAAAGDTPPLQVCLIRYGALQKNHKNEATVGS